ncbi:ATP-binding cassette domain-containing protein, partial [Tsukamurella soli]
TGGQPAPSRPSGPVGPPERQPAPARPAGPAQPLQPALLMQAGPNTEVERVPPHLRALAGNTGLYKVPESLRPPVQGGAVSIGRTPENDLVVPDMLVSRHHARLLTTPAGVVIEDLHSANGTQVNGRRIGSPTKLSEGDLVTLGNSDLVLREGVLQRPQPQALAGAGLMVRALGLTVDGDKTLLRGVELNAAPGTLTAIIGPSGAGKSTVARVVAGAASPTVGLVEFEGRDVHRDFDAMRSRIGMVPQDDVLHRQLTVRQALRYAAELRLPPDMSKADRDLVIDGVLDELQLTEHADTRVDKLSGGQRKRASVAMELLTGPSLLILDEPTSGLDPALDKQVMQTLRNLANAGRVVVVVTHSLTHLDMCDQVLLLAPGGRTAYCGTPAGVRTAMGTSDWAEIFDYVAKQPEAAAQRYQAANPPTQAQPAIAPHGTPLPAPKTSWVRQLSVVARRQFRLILADRGYLAFLALLPFVLGGITLIVPATNGLRKAPSDSTSGPMIILVLLVIGACFMGAALTARDLVGERPIYRREHAVGLRPGAYLTAKTLVYFVAAVVQAAVMVGIAIAGIKQPEIQGDVISSAPVELLVAICVLACVSTLVGLLISALARSNEQIMPMLVVVVMLQLVMSGGLFGIAGRMVLEQVSWIFPSRWGFAAIASTVDLQHVTMVPDPQSPGDWKIVNHDPLWNHTRGAWLEAIGALALIGLVLWVGVWARIRRRVG